MSETPENDKPIKDKPANDRPVPGNAAAEKQVSNVAPLRKTVPCPECRRPSHRDHYPFCSDRCRNVDLSRWLTGSYAIPVADDESRADDDD